LKRERGRAPYSLIRALPLHPPRPPLGYDPLRGELAISELDRSFAPSPKSEERIARQHPCGPPPSFSPASPCSGLDRSASSLIAVAPYPLRYRASRPTAVRTSRFPYASGLEGLRLATAMNSPARTSRRNSEPCLAQPKKPTSGLSAGGGFWAPNVL
jgi:hypothetical protein